MSGSWANCSGVSLGSAPGGFRHRSASVPPWRSLRAHADTEASLTPYFRATSACRMPAFRSFAAASRRCPFCSRVSSMPAAVSASHPMRGDKRSLDLNLS